jgi:meiosis induction protein kinase IME2/SME1
MANGALGYTSASTLSLADRFEIIKEVGDGSFGSVALAKVRSAGANIAKRGSVVGLKSSLNEVRLA